MLDTSSQWMTPIAPHNASSLTSLSVWLSWKVQILGSEAMREQLLDTRLQNTIPFTLRQTLLVICGDQQYGHVLCAELADELATDATRRYGRAHIPEDPVSV